MTQLEARQIVIDTIKRAITAPGLRQHRQDLDYWSGEPTDNEASAYWFVTEDAVEFMPVGLTEEEENLVVNELEKLAPRVKIRVVVEFK